MSAPAALPDDLARAARHALAAAGAFAAMGALARTAHGLGAPETLIVFCRNLVSLAILAPWAWRAGRAGWATANPWGHLWRGAFGLSAMVCLFHATTHLKLATALLLNNTSPLFIPLLGWWLNRERPPAWLALTVPLGLLGVLLVLGPVATGGATGPDTLSAGIGLASGVLAAMAMVSLRRISHTEPATRIVFWFAVMGVTVMAPTLPFGWVTPSLPAALCLVGTGACATLGQLQLTRAYGHAPAAQVSLFGYSSVVFGGLLGWLGWGDVPGWRGLGGATLVVAACALTLWWGSRPRRRGLAAAAPPPLPVSVSAATAAYARPAVAASESSAVAAGSGGSGGG